MNILQKDIVMLAFDKMFTF